MRDPTTIKEHDIEVALQESPRGHLFTATARRCTDKTPVVIVRRSVVVADDDTLRWQEPKITLRYAVDGVGPEYTRVVAAAMLVAAQAAESMVKAAATHAIWYDGDCAFMAETLAADLYGYAPPTRGGQQ